MPAGKRHRSRPLPYRCPNVEIDDLGGVGSATATRVENLAIVVHHCSPIVPASVSSVPHRAPGSRALWVEIASGLLLARVEHQPVGSLERSGVVREAPI